VFWGIPDISQKSLADMLRSARNALIDLTSSSLDSIDERRTSSASIIAAYGYI
jgi:hypothetical protein